MEDPKHKHWDLPASKFWRVQHCKLELFSNSLQKLLRPHKNHHKITYLIFFITAVWVSNYFISFIAHVNSSFDLIIYSCIWYANASADFDDQCVANIGMRSIGVLGLFVPTNCLKWTHAYGPIDWTIICKFSLPVKLSSNLMWSPTKHRSKKTYTSIHDFSLTISLQVVYKRKLKSQAHHVPKCLLKTTHESYISIRHYGLRQPMKTNYLHGIRGFWARNEEGHFWKTIHNSEVGIMLSINVSQSKENIHSDVLPRSMWHQQWSVQPCILLLLLCQLASTALRLGQ